jgi:hypothetical protein
MQALDRTQPLLPLSPGQERRGHDYKHHGTTALLAALDTRLWIGRRGVGVV